MLARSINVEGVGWIATKVLSSGSFLATVEFQVGGEVVRSRLDLGKMTFIDVLPFSPSEDEKVALAEQIELVVGKADSLMLNDCSTSDNSLRRFEVTYFGNVLGTLNEYPHGWQGTTVADGSRHQLLLDEMASRLNAGTLASPPIGGDAPVVVDVQREKGFDLGETPCSTPTCAARRRTFRYLVSNTGPWRVKASRAFCFSCGAVYRLEVADPNSQTGRIRAHRE